MHHVRDGTSLGEEKPFWAAESESRQASKSLSTVAQVPTDYRWFVLFGRTVRLISGRSLA